MTQKLISREKSISDLLQTIEPKGIADESMGQTVEILLNLIKQLQSEVKELKAENQRLRDENNRLKGELGQPNTKPKKKGFENNHSSEEEQKTPKQHSKRSNPAELAARTMAQRRDISYATQTLEGTQAWDTFVSLVATTRKLGISFFEYVRDRISLFGNIPSLGTIIREKSALNPCGWSWMPG
jgi:regulator of replication initiation timing